MRHPRLIHRVWLGAAIPDRRHVAFRSQWERVCPGWQCVDWNDDLVAGLPLALASEYRTAPTYVHRADIVLVELVWRFGGMAVGYDMEPVRNPEPLIGESVGWCTPDVDGFPGGAFFGAVPRHAAVAVILETIGDRHRLAREWSTPNVDTGPYAWQAAIGDGGRMPGGLDVLGSTRTAYPVHYTDRTSLRDPAVVEKLRADPDVYAIHEFAGSWLDADAVAVR